MVSPASFTTGTAHTAWEVTTTDECAYVEDEEEVDSYQQGQVPFYTEIDNRTSSETAVAAIIDWAQS